MYIKDGIAYAGEPELLYEDSAPVEEYDLIKSPGTCSVNKGSKEDSLLCSICWRPTTETVIGKSRMSVSLRVPVTTTSSIVYDLPCGRLSLVSWARINPPGSSKTTINKISTTFIVRYWIILNIFRHHESLFIRLQK